MQAFEWPVRVYYEDTDSGGVVYHANYLKFMERARTEWLRHLGFEQDVLRAQYQCIFAVHSMQLNFRQPARFNDELLVRSRLSQVRGASMEFEQIIQRKSEIMCDATIKVACLNVTQFKACAIPSFILSEMQREC